MEADPATLTLPLGDEPETMLPLAERLRAAASTYPFLTGLLLEAASRIDGKPATLPVTRHERKRR